MKVYGMESVESLLESDGYLFKMVANEVGVILFPHTSEHSDNHLPGIRYADDSAGNALAAMVKPGRIEFRHHQSFPEERVHRVATAILRHPELAWAWSFAVSYRGRTLVTAKGS